VHSIRFAHGPLHASNDAYHKKDRRVEKNPVEIDETAYKPDDGPQHHQDTGAHALVDQGSFKVPETGFFLRLLLPLSPFANRPFLFILFSYLGDAIRFLLLPGRASTGSSTETLACVGDAGLGISNSRPQFGHFAARPAFSSLVLKCLPQAHAKEMALAISKEEAGNSEGQAASYRQLP
jgi:hypothetical protein